MKEYDLDDLFQKARTEEVETSVKEVQKWIGYATLVTVILGLLAKLKVFTLKPFIMYAAIITSVGIGVATVAFLPNETAKETPKSVRQSMSLPRVSQPVAKVETEVVLEALTPVVPKKEMEVPSPEPLAIIALPILENPIIETTNSSQVLFVKRQDRGKVIPIKSIKKVIVTGALNVDIIQGKTNEIRLLCSPEDEKYFSYDIKNGDLILTCKNEGGNFSNGAMKVELTLDNLEEIYCTGATNVTSNGKIQGKSLAIKVTGASDVTLDLDVVEVTLAITGASNLKLTGKANQLDIRSTGASDLSTDLMQVEKATVHATGASTVSVQVSKEINASATGGSTIYYKGEGVMKTQAVTGGATIKRM